MHVRTLTIGPVCLSELFESQVETSPRALAVLSDGDRVTYEALHARVQRLAPRLRAAGVCRGDRIGVCAEGTIDAVVAVLATLACGACYVPLDPAFPAERLAHMLADSSPRVVVGGATALARLPEGGPPVILLDRTSDPAPDDMGAMRSPLTRMDLAYIVYTSGSTGRPKGVAMPHGPLVDLVRWELDAMPVTPEERVAQFCSLSFDVSCLELFVALGSGSTLVLLGERLRRDPGAWARYVSATRVTRLYLPYVALQQLAEVVEEDFRDLDLSALVSVVSTAEQLRITPQIAGMFARLPRCALRNQYGPAETHVVSAHAMSGRSEVWPALPPIGSPLPSCRLSVRDASLEPVPAGTWGQLCIGGDCLARGYWDRVAATAERFVPDPSGPSPGTRMYLTGDVARTRPDGLIEYGGREDHQLKIRGFRVEPGEVEAVVGRQPGVAQTAVVGAPDGAGGMRLVAFVVPRTAEVDVDALYSRIRRELPDHLIPARCLVLTAMPLTPSGKVDRAALVRRAAAVRHAAPHPVLALDSVEARLADLWRRSGGAALVDSREPLLPSAPGRRTASRFEELVRRDFGLETPPALSNEDTIETLRAALGPRLVPGGWWSPLVTLRHGSASGRLLAVAGPGGGVRCYGPLASHLRRDWGVFALESPGALNGRTPSDDLEQLARTHVELVTGAWPPGPVVLLGWSLGSFVALAMARQLAEAGRAPAALVVLDTRAPATDPPHGRAIDIRIATDYLADLDLTAGRQGESTITPMGGAPRTIDDVLERLRTPDGAGHLTGRQRATVTAELIAMTAYAARPCPCPVVLLRGGGAPDQELGDATLGWWRLAGAGLAVVTVAERRRALLSPAGGPALGEAVAGVLDDL